MSLETSVETKGSSVLSSLEKDSILRPHLGRGRRRGFKRLAWKIAGYSSLTAVGLLALSAL